MLFLILISSSFCSAILLRWFCRKMSRSSSVPSENARELQSESVSLLSLLRIECRSYILRWASCSSVLTARLIFKNYFLFRYPFLLPAKKCNLLSNFSTGHQNFVGFHPLLLMLLSLFPFHFPIFQDSALVSQ